MKGNWLRAAWLAALVAATAGCAAPRILGRATLAPEQGVPGPGAPAVGVTLNFINLGGKLDESVPAVQTDAKGEYRSPVLPPGKYTVEAELPGYVIERTSVVLAKHGAKKAPFVLRKIGEVKGKSVKEGKDDNIPNPGEVQIKPPF
jgi:carboxypeptidase family protein